MVWKHHTPEIKNIIRDNVLIVPAWDGYWHLPGGIRTQDFDKVRNYTLWFMEHGYHKEGMKIWDTSQ